MLAVTSFNPQKQPYGRKCLKSLGEFFPGKVVAYLEGTPEEGARDFFSIPGVCDYLEKIKRVSGSDGGEPYDYRFDTNKFCRKVFAQDAVFDEDQYVFWFDADSYLLKPIPEEFLVGLVKDFPFAYLGRKNYTETGWLGFNTQHKRFGEFRKKYLDCFTSGRIFSLSEWHDCFAFDYARKGIPGNDLGKGAAMGHVLLKSVLAPYLEHCKGPKRKALGYSPGHQYSDPSCAHSLPESQDRTAFTSQGS